LRPSPEKAQNLIEQAIASRDHAADAWHTALRQIEDDATAAAAYLSGQAELYFEGIVYLPKQEVTVSGGATVFAPSPYTSYIGDTLRFVGNGELIINNDTTLTGLPIPTALMVQTNGTLALRE
jgi:hypothetical protein